jgi:hypothetical protein
MQVTLDRAAWETICDVLDYRIGAYAAMIPHLTAGDKEETKRFITEMSGIALRIAHQTGIGRR